MDTIWAKFTEYGLIGVIIGVLFLILWKMLVWVMTFIKEERVNQASERLQHNEERKVWLTQMKTQSDTWFIQMKVHGDILQKICSGIEEHDKRAEERGRYVRDEHNKMIENLNGQSQVLARINGFKQASV